MEHDGIIIGCAALYPFPDDRKAELACMAVHRAFRRGGRGDRLLKYSEEQARERGIQSLFVLTTRTEHWFLERGFVETDVSSLPPAKQQLYNFQRRSKVFVKKI
jgi:amino-acid N-acetyltransferase